MTTTHTLESSQVPADLAADLDEHGELLALEVERYLAARTRATAHPLVTKTTADLVTEALEERPAVGVDNREEDEHPAASGTVASPLTGVWRLLPDALLRIRRPRGVVDYRPLTVAEHLELTAAILERDWGQTARRGRWFGRRCILGAQVALYAMGYGDAQTADAAGTYLNLALRERGQPGPYEDWNEVPGRTRDQVLALVRAAAAIAREARR
ncbi:hypothetical protein [Streptomyces sp. TR06-5]|uniref:DUF6197 family protein n=1 Tax=Streptomyces sp. TR06-5 TaxID=3385976 RepID=UPI0039A22C8B